MKKRWTILLVLILCLSTLALMGCGSKKTTPYSEYNLSEYITLPDYNAYDTEVPEVNVTEEQIDEEIQTRLNEAKTVDKVTEGTVDKGDAVTISFKGTLADGTTDEGMNSEGYDLTLGEASMIDGFQEGLYGATIGKAVTLNLQFPDPYQNNPDLAGKDVTFEVTVLSKNVDVIPELDADFIKNNSDVTTEAEYRDYVKGQLEQDEYDNQLYDLKSEIYSKIVEETEVIKYPDKELEEQIDYLNLSYEAMAENNGYEDWETFLSEYFKIDQAEYDEQVKLYAEEMIKQEMIVYSIAEKEKLEVTDKEYDEYLDSMLEAAGFTDRDAFKEYAGMTIDEYAEQNKLDRDLLLTKELDAIYDKISEGK